MRMLLTILHDISTNNWKNTNHRQISLTGTTQCNSEISGKNSIWIGHSLIFLIQYYRKSSKKIKNHIAYFGKIGRFLLTKSTSNFLNDL